MSADPTRTGEPSAAGDPPAADDLQRLYRDAIRRHSSTPVGYREDIRPTHRREEYNPQCGDRVEVMLRMEGETIEAAAFDGEACAICMASSSLLCSLTPGRTTSELRELGEGLKAALNEPAGSSGSAAEPRLKPPPVEPLLQPLLGVRPYPSRVQCALLPWKAADRALPE